MPTEQVRMIEDICKVVSQEVRRNLTHANRKDYRAKKADVINILTNVGSWITSIRNVNRGAYHG